CCTRENAAYVAMPNTASPTATRATSARTRRNRSVIRDHPAPPGDGRPAGSGIAGMARGIRSKVDRAARTAPGAERVDHYVAAREPGPVVEAAARPRGRRRGP